MGNTSKHKEYPGNIVQRYKQMIDDEVQMAQDIEEWQKQLMENERETLSQLYDVEGDELDRMMEGYADEDKFGEYLVDGAILRCTMATLDDFPVSDGNIIKLKLDAETEEDRMRTTLHVLENPMSANNLRYATVKDTEMFYNIAPFRCNCTLPADRGEEVDQIIADSECSSYGVCRYLMDLSENWDNMAIEGTSYLKKVWRVQGGGGVERVLGLGNIFDIEEEAEGITMTSVLFCKHGGIIYPETSGQIIEQFDNLTEEEILFVETIYGEANRCSEYSWQAIANVIMNRIGIREWRNYTTVTEVIKNSGFDSYTYKNDPFREAVAYFENRDYSNATIEQMIEIVIPIYRGNGEDITGGAVLYYSPNAQSQLHKQNPDKYREVPNWNFSLLEEVIITGAENDDFKFYKYK